MTYECEFVVRAEVGHYGLEQPAVPASNHSIFHELGIE